jgi:fructosamine-3-kinase
LTGFASRVAALTGLAEGRLERLAGGDLSQVLLVRRADGRLSVAKGGAAVPIEAAMLRSFADSAVPAPVVEAEHDGVLLLEYVENDRVFSPAAWTSIGEAVRRLHARRDARYGWPLDFRIGTVELDNRRGSDWPSFWGQQRLVSAAGLLDRPWRERIDRLAARLDDLLPAHPPPAQLHGDLWSGNILVRHGRLAALIDPACYFGDGEVDLAMLCLFDSPGDSFWDAYGRPASGWAERKAVYQLFPAILHLRLFGGSYGGMVDRLLGTVGA